VVAAAAEVTLATMAVVAAEVTLATMLATMATMLAEASLVAATRTGKGLSSYIIGIFF